MDQEEAVEGASHEELLIAACKIGDVELLKTVIDEDLNINATDGIKNTAFHYAAAIGSTECLELLLKMETPLHMAASNEERETIQMLLQGGANPTVFNRNKQKPIQLTDDKKIRALLSGAATAQRMKPQDMSDFADDSDDEDEEEEEED